MKLFSRIALSIVVMALNIIKGQFDNIIKSELVTLGAKKFTELLVKILNKLKDNDPDNKAQIDALLKVELPVLIDELFAVLEEYAIARVQDESLRELINSNTAPVKEMFKALLDADPNNKAQIEAIKDKYGKQSLESAIDFAIAKTDTIKDEIQRDFSRELLIQVKEQIIPEILG